MQRKRLCLGLQMVAVGGFLLMVAARAHGEPLDWGTFTARDGLLGLHTVSVLRETRDGRIWCGTSGGAACFDGYGWRVHRPGSGGLSDNDIWAMHERADDTLWFATQHGVSVYHLKKEQWVTKDYPSLTRLARHFVIDIAEQPTGTLWFATPDGLYRYDLTHRSRPLQRLTLTGGDPQSRNRVRKLFVQSNGALWICSRDGVRVLAPNGAMNYMPIMRGVQVLNACEWSDGTLWFAVDTMGGVYVYDSKRPPEQRWRWRDLRPLVSGTASYFHIHGMIEAPNGDRWLATDGQGVLVLDAAGKLPRQLNKSKSGLVSDSVFALCRRSDGAFWFGTPFGISVYDPRLLQPVSGQEQRFGWERGKIAIWDAAARAYKSVPLPSALERAVVEKFMEESDGTLWVGTNRGLWRYQKTTDAWLAPPGNPPAPVAEGRIRTVYRQRDGTLWVGTIRNGVYSYHDSRGWRDESGGKAQPPLRLDIFAISETARGTVWLGTEKGLMRWRGDRWETFSVENTRGGLPSDAITALTGLPDGRLVIGTGKGIAFYDEQADVWSALTALDGWEDESCASLKTLEDGRVRVGVGLDSQKDLTLPTPPETFLIAGSAVLAQTPMGTTDVYRLQPAPSAQSQTIARHTLVTARLGEQVVRSKRVTVQAFAVSPWRGASASEFQYQFELDGKRLPWQREPFRTFDNLKKGEHVIRVRACDRFLNVDPTPVQFSFRVQPPLPAWLLWTTGTGFALAMFALLFGLATHRQRAERIRMLHELKVGHDIQTSFLPREEVRHGDYEIVSRYTPAIEVGGDFYNVFPISDEKIGIVLGDVSGKGVGGAMYMSVAMTLVEALGREEMLPPAVVLHRANSHLVPKLRNPRMMVTLFYGVLDMREHTLTFANAGQEFPLLCSDDFSRYLEVGGTPLGVLHAPLYEDHTVALPPGSALVLYSDGFVEMMGKDGKLLGFDRFQQMVTERSRLSAPQMVASMVEATLRFGNGHHERDDLTLVVVKRS